MKRHNKAYVNPRPDTVFRHLWSDRLVRPPWSFQTNCVVELSEKDQEIALAEYSRLVVLFLVIGHICPSYGRSKVKFSEIL